MSVPAEPDPAEQARRRFELEHRGFIFRLARAGHRPYVAAVPTRRGRFKVQLRCDACGHRYRRGIPHRWQRLSPNRPCADL